MRSRTLASSLIGLGCLTVANAAACAERRNPAVVIDSGWSGHYAESGCQETMAFFDEHTASRIRNFGCGSVPACPEFMLRSAACTSGDSPKEQADRFESRLVAEFATNPACKGARVARYQGPDRALSAADQAVMSAPHWQLVIDFVVGSPRQSWLLLYGGEANARQGEGATAPGIAHDVCVIVLGHDAAHAR